MKIVKVGAGLLALGLAAGVQADVTTLSENFDNFAGLGPAGWVFTNNSAPAGLSWFGGNGVLTGQSGGATSYVAANFNSASGGVGVIDNWLISPEFAMAASGTLDFWTQSADDGFFDQLEVRFSSGPGSAVSGFTTLLATIGSDSASTYPTNGWAHYSLALGSGTTGRIAFRYLSSDASNADYIGIDTVSVTVVPEPASIALSALALAAAAGAARRRKAAVSTPSMA